MVDPGTTVKGTVRLIDEIDFGQVPWKTNGDSNKRLPLYLFNCRFVQRVLTTEH